MKLNDKLPDFELRDVSGKTVNHSDFRSTSVLIIVFSCNHCPYVQAYEERLKDIQNRYADKGVQIIAINSNDETAYPEDSFENMVERSREMGFNFPYLHDADQSVAKKFEAEFTPQLFVFNVERELVYLGKIDDNWREPAKVQVRYLETAINEMLEGKEISMPETYAIGCTIKWRKY